MNQLVNINPDMTMSSLDIVKVINAIRKQEGNNTELRHSDFLKKVAEVIGETTSEKFRSLYKDAKGEERPCYNFPKRESMLMAMSYSYTVQAAVYDAWQELESKQQFTIPQTYGEALLECGRLAIEVEIQAKQLEQQKPQVEFANDVANTCDSISIGGYAGLLASSGYDIGQNRLFAWLREKGYLTTRKNRPSIQAIDSGWFKWIETTYICPRTGLPKVSGQPTITGKGQIYLRKKLIKELGGK